MAIYELQLVISHYGIIGSINGVITTYNSYFEPKL